ncbi:hypothetical protein CaCOL14_006853 [Colletotrichum acutatum]
MVGAYTGKKGTRVLRVPSFGHSVFCVTSIVITSNIAKGDKFQASVIFINSISMSMSAVLSRRPILFLQAQLYGKTCRIQTQPLHSCFQAQYAISKQAVEGIVEGDVMMV